MVLSPVSILESHTTPPSAWPFMIDVNVVVVVGHVVVVVFCYISCIALKEELLVKV